MILKEEKGTKRINKLQYIYIRWGSLISFLKEFENERQINLDPLIGYLSYGIKKPNL